jgi:hypothetical protein
LLGTGIVQGSSFVAQSGASIYAGDSTSASSYGTLNFAPAGTGGSFNFQSGSTVYLGLNPGGTSDLLNFTGDGSQSLLFNGNLTVGPSSFTPTGPQIFNLLDWASLSSTSFASRFTSTGTLLGNGDEASGLDLPDISGSGYVWDISSFTTNGTIAIIAVPEPSRALLLIFGFVSSMLRRRRPSPMA